MERKNISLNDRFLRFYNETYPKIKGKNTLYAILQKIAHPKMFYAAKILEENAHAERRKLFSLLLSEEMPIAMAILDKEGKIAGANRKMHCITESENGGPVGTDMFASDGFGRILKAGLEKNASYAEFDYLVDFDALAKAGAKTGKAGVQEFKVGAFAIRNNAGEIENYLIMLESKAADEKEIIRLAEELRQKDEFVRVLAHDIRNPLSSVIEILDLLREENGLEPEAKKRFTEACYKKANLILEMTVKLLEWYRLIDGRKKAEPALILLYEAVEVAAALHDMRKKGLAFENLVPRHMQIYCDPDMLDVILRNMVSNAIKYSRDGGKIRVEAQNKSDGMVEIKIIDQGIGMSKETASKIFEINRKGRLSQPGTRGEEGTGLGLVLVKRMVEANGGSIEVQSEVGVGTTFTIILPGEPKEIARGKA
ncbi:MAG: HAMP domain-containing sensor histidine kinase [Candidatus Anstonellaceae archaeon]